MQQSIELHLPAEELFARGLDSSPYLVSACASVLEEICAKNDAARELQHTPLLTKFHSVSKPGLSITSYLKRIRKYSSCSNSCFVIALIFLDRVQKLHESPVISLDSLSVHRLVITAVMLASKVYDDMIQTNKIYATIGGCTVEEINQLEIQLLNALQFQIDITPTQFSLYHAALINHLNKIHYHLFRPTQSPSNSVPSPPPIQMTNCHERCHCRFSTKLHIDPLTEIVCDCCSSFPTTAKPQIPADPADPYSCCHGGEDGGPEKSQCQCQSGRSMKLSPTSSDYSLSGVSETSSVAETEGDVPMPSPGQSEASAAQSAERW